MSNISKTISEQAEGAWNIICARAFYSEDGTVSLIKVSAIIGIIGLGVFFCPTFLTTVICLGLFSGFVYLLLPVVKALFNGELSAAAKANKNNSCNT